MAGRRSVSARLARLVGERARYLCEYCRLRQDLCAEPFEIDHIIPRTDAGPTILSNLWLACSVCNNAKADRTRAADPISGRLERPFNPRIDDWSQHFRWSQDFGTIIGRTAVGRASVAALNMNHPRVGRLRRLWVRLRM